MRGNAIAAVVVALVSFTATGCGGQSEKNAAPLADAGPDRTVVAGSWAMLDGSGSSDRDGDALTYSWSLTTRPAGSSAFMDGGSAEFPALKTDVAGTYVLTLTVDDGRATSPPDDVTVVAVISAGVPDTYQVTSYTDSPGEDSDYLIGWGTYSNYPPGTVTDSVTQLVWQGWDDATPRTWEAADAYCADLYFPGAGSGWRLPTPYELATIAMYGLSHALPEGLFVGGEASNYWTGVARTATDAWVVDFDLGGVTAVSQLSSAYTRCVRGGPSGFVFSANGDGTVSDQARGLMWQQADDGAKKVWEQALAYCEGLTLGGFGDWRLPTVKDLTSIQDFSRYPVGDPTFFPTAKASDYWSSTTVQSAPTTAWQASFLDGHVGPGLDKATAAAYVRCVRGQ